MLFPRRSVCYDAPSIALDLGVNPRIVYIAVEDFVPLATGREPNSVGMVVKRGFIQGNDNHHIPTNSGQPALECDDAIIVMDVHDLNALPHKGGVPPTKPHQVAREPMLIGHLFLMQPGIRAIQPIPVDQEIIAGS